MTRGATSRGRPIVSCLRIFAVVAAFLMLMVPARAHAFTGGGSQWPTDAGSSWAEEPAEVLPSAEEDTGSVEQTAQPAVSAPTIAFPVAGDADYTDSFGAPRPGGRSHEGIDIFADKMTPVVAIAAGTVSLLRNGIGTDCCAVRIRHDDGQSSLYLHLNNDTPGTDDGQGYGIAEGISVGTRVEAGTVIGYVGDSGNAEDTPSHLHIEINDQSGTVLNPYPYLQMAQGADPALFASAVVAQPETLPETGLPVTGLAMLSVALLMAGGTISGGRRRGP